MTAHNLQVEVTLTVRVPLSATGSLADGALGVVERVDTVDHVVDADIRQVSPSLNDTTVELVARVAFTDAETVACCERALEDGFGVKCVNRVEAVEPDAPPVMEVG